MGWWLANFHLDLHMQIDLFVGSDFRWEKPRPDKRNKLSNAFHKMALEGFKFPFCALFIFLLAFLLLLPRK